MSGTSLAEIHGDNHLDALGKHILQRLIDPAYLPILERLRPRFPEEFGLEMIPDEVTAQPREMGERGSKLKNDKVYRPMTL